MKNLICMLALGLSAATLAYAQPIEPRRAEKDYIHFLMTHWQEPSVCHKDLAHYHFDIKSDGKCHDLVAPMREYELGFRQMYKDQRIEDYGKCDVQVYSGPGCTGKPGKIEDIAHEYAVRFNCVLTTEEVQSVKLVCDKTG